jgi:hypothetical protein
MRTALIDLVRRNGADYDSSVVSSTGSTGSLLFLESVESFLSHYEKNAIRNDRCRTDRGIEFDLADQILVGNLFPVVTP